MTKIVGTLGPKSRSVDTISACLKAGMSGNCSLSVSLSLSLSMPSGACSLALELICWLVGLVFPPPTAVARFDFSWGDAAYHQETLENLKLSIKSTKKLCAVSSPCSRLVWRLGSERTNECAPRS